MRNLPDIYPHELEAAGIALFGESWRSRMAKEIGCDKSRVTRWMDTNKKNSKISKPIVMSGAAKKNAWRLIRRSKKVAANAK